MRFLFTYMCVTLMCRRLYDTWARADYDIYTDKEGEKMIVEKCACL